MRSDPILVPSSPAYRALVSVWRGTEMTIISSPPGAGKTEVITSIVPVLVTDAGLSVVVATPTINGAYDVARRIETKMPTPGRVVLSGSSFTERRSNGVRVDSTVKPKPGRVLVKTIAGMKFSRDHVDVLVVDEAFQATALDVREALAYVDQALLVGDPGQIGPVVTINTQAWDASDFSPAKPAPVVFQHWPGAVLVHLESSYRLGESSVNVIGGLYDFPFTSTRPPAMINERPEIEVTTIPFPSAPTDPTIFHHAIQAVRSLIGSPYTYAGHTRVLQSSDCALLATRNEQVSALEALAASTPGVRGATVGTADSLQGGQWPATIVIDPLLGASIASDHALTTGRLCVMCSRHIAHLSFITSDSVADVIDRSSLTEADKTLHHEIRTSLMKETQP